MEIFAEKARHSRCPLPGGERHLDLLPRPGRRPAGADRRPARGDVRHPRTLTRVTRTDRARGALYGLAIGDALGMPTQLLSRAQIASRYGMLTGFEPGPPDHP